jgi:hypothetical protein
VSEIQILNIEEKEFLNNFSNIQMFYQFATLTFAEDDK